MCGLVGVAVGVSVGVLVGPGGVTVGFLVGVTVGVSVGVFVGSGGNDLIVIVKLSENVRPSRSKHLTTYVFSCNVLLPIFVSTNKE